MIAPAPAVHASVASNKTGTRDLWRKLAWPLLLACGFLIFISASSIYLVISSQSSQEMMNRALQVENSLRGILAVVRIAESEQRGYLLTGDPQYLDTYRAGITATAPVIAELKAEIGDPAKVVYKAMEAVLVPPPWYSGRVVLLGDAAHATTPHLGQGAGMAIEDAVVLAEELNSDGSVRQQLERYMERRYERCRFIVESSELIGKFQMNEVDEVDEKSMVEKMQQVTAQPI